MHCRQVGNEIEISNIEDFDLVKTFECGQCFRWNQTDDGKYTGVAMGRAAELRQSDGKIYISSSMEDFDSIWQKYFDLDRDYKTIRESLCIDSYMKKASDFGAGIRILRQDRWEAFCSFIISQCNNIPRIKKIIETLCSQFGREVEFNGKVLYSFPKAEEIAQLEPEDLAPLRCGYRAPYIIDGARAVASGALDLDKLAEGSFDDALKALKSVHGVGDKVANCVILFGLQMLDAFPVDVWMKRAMTEQYGKNFDPKIFGKYAGIAQQYIYYYARSGNGEKT